ncbi:MAG TPA: ATP-binding protein [Bacteroidia bacterium]|nr:ATP-binding protein [Bacteroidia bacterium]
MKKIWNVDIKVKIGLGFAVILLVLIGVQYGLNRSIADVISTQQQLLNSTKLSTEVESIKTSVVFFESKVKSYVLTGNDSLLEETNEKYLTNIVTKFSDLKKLSPNKEQIASIDKLVKLLNTQIQFTDEVKFQYQLNPKKSVNLIKSGKGRYLMAQIIQEFDKIHAIEEAKFAKIIILNQQDSERVKQMDTSAYIFAFLLVLLCVWVLYRDVNKREKLEKELIVAQKKAEDAAIIKEQFMANMSHEIRTPLNAILGFNHRLNKTVLNAEQKEYAKAVQSSGENLLNIVNDILDFSKIEAGMVRIEEIRFNLPGLLHSVITMFFVQTKEKKIPLTLNLSDNVPQLVIGDPTRLTQILMNLISNAIKFTKQGSVHVFVNATDINDTVIISFKVQDTGIGIPEDKIAEIFDRFTQAKSDTSRIYGGTGLGLAIVKKLVELQGGTILVESIKGKGSVFTFTIPYKVADTINDEVKIKPEEIKKVEVENKINVLVVEDNLLNQKLAGFMLKDLGCDYELCSNGKLAIEKLKTTNYHAILMDIQMPEMNGYETTEYIREELKLTIPIIAMTAHALPGEREKCINLGMTDYISKPIKETDLNTIMEKYINVTLTH